MTDSESPSKLAEPSVRSSRGPLRGGPALGLGLLLGLLSSGCLGSPSPLAPGLKGSVGIPHHGVLTEAQELPASGPGYRRFREKGTAYFGLPRLVSTIERVSEQLETTRPGGSTLVVGDLSGRRGGKVPRHNSHRSGRDVDFLFFVETPEGIPTENPGFFLLDNDGFVRVPDGRLLRLDVPRQWAFIKLLLQAPEINVQFLFISESLEAHIMNYALATEVDWDLLYRAESVMLQPADSLPHADHIHMRIACLPEETVSGCFGGGPAWPWYEPLPRLTSDDRQLLSKIELEDPFTHPPLPREEALPPAEVPPLEIPAHEASGPVVRRTPRAGESAIDASRQDG